MCVGGNVWEGGVKDIGAPGTWGHENGGDMEGNWKQRRKMKQSWCPHTSTLVSHKLDGDTLLALIIQEKLIQVTGVFIQIKFLIKFLNHYYFSPKERKSSGII